MALASGPPVCARTKKWTPFGMAPPAEASMVPVILAASSARAPVTDRDRDRDKGRARQIAKAKGAFRLIKRGTGICAIFLTKW